MQIKELEDIAENVCGSVNGHSRVFPEQTGDPDCDRDHSAGLCASARIDCRRSACQQAQAIRSLAISRIKGFEGDFGKGDVGWRAEYGDRAEQGQLTDWRL